MTPLHLQVVRPLAKELPRLTILDSSFNPPTLAHLALLRLCPPPYLLLHSVRNADKGSSAEATHQRVKLMEAFADYSKDGPGIALVQEPYFVLKAKVVREELKLGQKEISWVVGLDTIVRIYDEKYYGGSKEAMLEQLKGFFEEGNRLVCAKRDQDDQDFWKRKEIQDSLEKSWIQRKDAVSKPGISSTAARDAVKKGEWGTAEGICGPKVVAIVKELELYQ